MNERDFKILDIVNKYIDLECDYNTLKDKYKYLITINDELKEMKIIVVALVRHRYDKDQCIYFNTKDGTRFKIKIDMNTWKNYKRTKVIDKVYETI